MLLIAIIIVWGIYHFTKITHAFQRYDFSQRMLTSLETRIGRSIPSYGAQCVILWLIPILLANSIVFLLQHSFGALGVLFADIIILMYVWSYQTMVVVLPQQVRQQTRYYFSEALQQVFPALFWLLVLGPVAALFYDFTRRLQLTRYAPQANQLLMYLEWLPVRLLAFGYALAGYFPPAFTYWCQHLWRKPQDNLYFLENCGLAALNGELEEAPTDIREPQQAQALVKRAQRMLLGMLAIFILGRWIY